jgi:RNA polymerase sigma factor (sigma-70 family)
MATTNLVERFLKFQTSGEGFDGVWTELGPICKQFARQNLRKLGVCSKFGIDPWAVDDVVSQTLERLLGLARPKSKGRFKPSKAKERGLSGFRGWVSRIVRNEAINWTRIYRDGRSVKITPESGFTWNDLPDHEEGGSILKRIEAKVQRPDLLPILEECIGMLPDPLQRKVIECKLYEELSERETARKLGTTTSMAHRRLQDAYALLRLMLTERGVDVAWLAV